MGEEHDTNGGMKGERDRRPTIGLLTDWLEYGYQTSVYAGIADVVQEQDVNLISFVLGSLEEPYGFVVQRNILGDLVSPDVLDGLIVMSGALSNFVTAEELSAFVEGYRLLPMVSIAIALPGIPSVLVDNASGMRGAVNHLVEEHGLGRIAFIRGPVGHEEADARFRVYKETLEDHALPFVPDRVVTGDFTIDSGAEAMRALLDERGLSPPDGFEAVIAANDFMALGALQVLSERGKRVPEDVAVVGFDDVEEGRYITTPLTSVRQPFYRQGRQAATMLLEMLAGGGVAEEVVFPTEVIVRRTCGYLRVARDVTEEFDGSCDRLPPHESLESALSAQREAILAEMTLALADSSRGADPAWSEQLLASFSTEIDGEPTGAFIATLDGILRQAMLEEDDAEAWHAALSVMHRHLLPVLACDNVELSRADMLWQRARILVGEVARHVQINKRLQGEQQAIVLSQISSALNRTFPLAELTDVIAEELPRAGVGACYLSLYEEGQEMPPEWSRLMLAYDENGRIEVGEGYRFPSRDLVPQGMLPETHRYNLIVLPLFFRHEQIGFVVFGMEERVRRIYEIMRQQISSSLKGALLIEGLEQAERALEQKAEELVQSNQELEQFAYVASHDLQEPLRMVTSYLQLLKRRYGGQLDEAADEFIEFAVDGASRMQQLINALLMYSRIGTKGEPPVPIASEKALNQALLNLQVAIEEKQAIITYDELPIVVADELQLAQLFQNLVGNAIKFHREGVKPEVHIGARREGHMWQFCVRDNGIGIEPRHFDHLFELFRRLHARDEYPGTGIGLAVCKKIADRHGGRIWVESEPELGSTFFFTLPAIPQ
jgi:signal transduction histidine kinase/DNA-binding LacI/PurR family transcriptional regulator